ncbi:DNA-binding protein [Nocardioides sp. J2M5]|uniref:DNA-binding protein n=1 Tax=Nocardioides palaemonis TaxID=2829810 RepID=UPI001BA53DE0|nr:DNA-binding protein [Nocardioides palaemonis]MBS2939597.1 DNA-binding protein [Nocardioides palaemonis]
MPEHLMGATEIAALLDVTRQRVQQLAKTDGFPRPYDVLAMGQIWLRSDIETWARETGRIE